MTSQDFFATHPVFTRDEFVAARVVLGERSPRTSDSLLRQHHLRGSIMRIRRGLYASIPKGMDAAVFQPDPFLVTSKLRPDTVIACHAALQFHGASYSEWSHFTGFSNTVLQTVTLGIASYALIRPRPHATRHHGLSVETQAHAGGTIAVTSLERTLVDIMDRPNTSGGWEEVWRSLEMVPFFDLEAVIAYTLALGRPLTTARVGYYLDTNRDRLFVEEHHLDRLSGHLPRQKRYFDRRRQPGRLVSRWKLIVPEQIALLRWAEVV